MRCHHPVRSAVGVEVNTLPLLLATRVTLFGVQIIVTPFVLIRAKTTFIAYIRIVRSAAIR